MPRPLQLLTAQFLPLLRRRIVQPPRFPATNDAPLGHVPLDREMGVDIEDVKILKHRHAPSSQEHQRLARRCLRMIGRSGILADSSR